MTTLRARFDGKVLVPEGPVDLPTGPLLKVQVDLADPADPPPGSPAAILKALEGLAKLSPEDMAEFERTIEEGKDPVNYGGAFDEDAHGDN
jgi:hypothetical protein